MLRSIRILREGEQFSLTALLLAFLFLIAACGVRAPEDAAFDLSIVDGKLAGDQTTFVADQGGSIILNFSSDRHGEIHLHGYELKQNVGPGNLSSITFMAEATGRYGMEFHPVVESETEHSHGNEAGHSERPYDETKSCGIDANRLAIRLSVEEAFPKGHYRVSVETDNFDISESSGNHWHLTSNGEAIGMYFDATAEINLGMGIREIKAQLNTSGHCSLPVFATLMIGENDNGVSHKTESKHDHAPSGETIPLGALEIRPR